MEFVIRINAFLQGRWRWASLTLLVASGVFMMSCSTFVASFGQYPDGERLELIKTSKNYVNGEFQYYVPTSLWTGGGRLSYLKETFFGESKQVRPDHPLPIVKTDLSALDKEDNLIVWLGHSTFFIQLDGKRILIDPVLSSYTSPLPFISSAFDGEYPYSAETIPDIDYVIISHDHWDHLDYPTMSALQNKVKAVILPLGVGSHLVTWGYPAEKIHEADWNEDVSLGPDFNIHVLPARHFSGRGLFCSNQTLWASFLLETPTTRIFYSGDSGFGPHFAEIGKRFGHVDLAIMESGQYDQHWAQVHMSPEDAVQAALDMRATMLLPAHSGRFALASHAWDEPYERISAASEGKNLKLQTPEIGEVVDIGNPNQSFSRWWIERPRKGEASTLAASRTYR